MILHSWGQVTEANSLYGTNTYFWRARPRPDDRRVPNARLLSQTLAYPEVATHHSIATSQVCSRELCSHVDAWYTGHSACHSDKDIFTLRQRYRHTPTKIRIDRYSLWKSPTRALFRVVHFKSHKNPFWCSLAILFALPSQRQKVVKLFSSRFEHSSHRAASLGWSEGLHHYRMIPVSQLLTALGETLHLRNFRPRKPLRVTSVTSRIRRPFGTIPMHAHYERTSFQRFLSNPPRSFFKKLIVSTPQLLRNLHTMSLQRLRPTV